MLYENLPEWNLKEVFLLLLDIALVTFLFYRIFLLISRTRALQLLIGIVLLMLASVLARYLELKTLSWVITNISTYLAIAVIILMQPELRRLMASIGYHGRFFGFRPKQYVPIKKITNAVKHMAHQRIGSLIVILRELKPQGIIEQAVALNADISSELIETVFWKEAPLHDGAMIIEGQKIVAASCYLPLSNSRKLKKTHGARHRAALGFSEESDAIIIVTSEESGNISILINGEIISPRKAYLETFLRQILNESDTEAINKGPAIEIKK